VKKMPKTFAHRLNNAKNMLAGLTLHADQLSKRGITADSVTKANQLYDQTSTLQNERNSLKARCQEATVQAEQLMTELENFCSEAKKLVRIEFPKETWPEFGFRRGEYAGQTAAATTATQIATPEKNS
jgi:hypothetical protein